MSYRTSPIMKALGYGKEDDEYSNDYVNGEESTWDSAPEQQYSYGRTSPILKQMGYGQKEVDQLQSERNQVNSTSKQLNDLGLEPNKPSIFEKAGNAIKGGIGAVASGVEKVFSVPAILPNFLTGVAGDLNKYGERADNDLFKTDEYKKLQEQGYDVRINSDYVNIIDKKTNKLVKSKDMTDEQRLQQENLSSILKESNKTNGIGVKEIGEAIGKGFESAKGGFKGAWTGDYDGLVDLSKINERNRESANLKNRDDAEKAGKPFETIGRAVTLNKLSEESYNTIGDVGFDIGASMLFGNMTDIDGASKMLKYLKKTDKIKNVDELADIGKATEIVKKSNPFETFAKEFEAKNTGKEISQDALKVKWEEEISNTAQQLSTATKKTLGGMTDIDKSGMKVFGKEITTDMLDNLKDTNSLGTKLTKIGLSLYSPVGALSNSGLGDLAKKSEKIKGITDWTANNIGAGKIGEQRTNMIEKPEMALQYANQVLQKDTMKRLKNIRLEDLRKTIDDTIKSKEVSNGGANVTDAVENRHMEEVTKTKTEQVDNPEFNSKVEEKASNKLKNKENALNKKLDKLETELKDTNVDIDIPIEKQVKATLREPKIPTNTNTKASIDKPITEPSSVVETPITKPISESSKPRTILDIVSDRRGKKNLKEKLFNSTTTKADDIKGSEVTAKGSKANVGYNKSIDEVYNEIFNKRISDEMDLSKAKTTEEKIAMIKESKHTKWKMQLEKIENDYKKEVVDKKVKQFEELGINITDEQRSALYNQSEKQINKLDKILSGKVAYRQNEKMFLDTFKSNNKSQEDLIFDMINKRKEGKVTNSINYNEKYKASQIHEKYITEENMKIKEHNKKYPNNKKEELKYGKEYIPGSGRFNNIDKKRSKNFVKSEPTDSQVKKYLIETNQFGTTQRFITEEIEPLNGYIFDEFDVPMAEKHIQAKLMEVGNQLGIKFDNADAKKLVSLLDEGNQDLKPLKNIINDKLKAKIKDDLSYLSEDELDMYMSSISNRKAPKIEIAKTGEKKVKPITKREVANFDKTEDGKEIDLNIDILKNKEELNTSSDKTSDKGYGGTEAEFNIYNSSEIGKPAVDYAIGKAKDSKGKITNEYLSKNLKKDDITAYMKDYVFENNRLKKTDGLIDSKIIKSIDGNEDATRMVFRELLDNQLNTSKQNNAKKLYLEKKSLDAKLDYIFGGQKPVGIDGIKSKVEESLKFKETPLTKNIKETPKVEPKTLTEPMPTEIKKFSSDLIKGTRIDPKRIERLVDKDYAEALLDANESLIAKKKNIKNLETNIDKVKEELAFVVEKRFLSSSESLIEEYKTKYPKEVDRLQSKIPMYKEIEKQFKDMELIESTATLGTKEKEVYDKFIKDMAFVAEREGIAPQEADFLGNYVVHMLKPEHLTDKVLMEKARSIGLIPDELMINEPFNVHQLTRKLQGTVSEINKTAKDKLGVELFEDNIYKLWYGRMASSEKYVYKKNMIRDVMETGMAYEYTKFEDFKPTKEHKTWQEYNQAMYKKHKDENLIVVEINKADYSKKKKVTDVRTDEIKEGSKLKKQSLEEYTKDVSNIEDGTEFSSITQDLSGYTSNNIEDMTLKDFSDKLSTGSYLVDKRGWEYYQKSLEELTEKDSNAMLDMYDTFNNLFKKQAVFSARFLKNNIIGNTFSSYMTSGVNLMNPKKMVEARKIRKGIEFDVNGTSSNEIREYLVKHGGLSTGTEADFGKEYNTKAFMNDEAKDLAQIDKAKTKWEKALQVADRPFNTLFKMSSKIEEEAKIINFITHLENGYSKADALEMTNKALFDYSDLTNFEKGTMKRIIPFYTYMRKNIPLQYELLANKPAKYMRINEMYRDASQKNETEQERALRPDYMKNNLALGEGKYLATALPMFDLSKPFSPSEIGGSISPLIKTPIELITGKQMFSDRDISKYDKTSEKVKYALESTNPLIAMVNKLTGTFSDDPDKVKKASDTALGALGLNDVKESDLTKAQKTTLEEYNKELQNQYYEYLDKNPLIKAKLKEEREKPKKYTSPLLKGLGYGN